MSDNVLTSFLENSDSSISKIHNTMSWAGDLFSAYMKMESVEFYAELLYRTTQLGGPRMLSSERLAKLYELTGRRADGRE